jgi:hypothetical protein
MKAITLEELPVAIEDGDVPLPPLGYMIKGRVRMHTLDGHQDFGAGEAGGASA